jgi:hypothetical protein
MWQKVDDGKLASEETREQHSTAGKYHGWKLTVKANQLT